MEPKKNKVKKWTYGEVWCLCVRVSTRHDEAVSDPELLPVLGALGDVHGLAVQRQRPRRGLANRAPAKKVGRHQKLQVLNPTYLVPASILPYLEMYFSMMGPDMGFIIMSMGSAVLSQ